MSAIAKRRIVAVLAVAEEYLLLFLQREFAGSETRSLVRAVAHRLIARKTAGAPKMIPRFEFDGTGLRVVDFR